MSVKQPPRKHMPQRSCLVCREKTDKRLLTRIIRTPEGTVVVDPTGKQNGRGAYLCHRQACWDRALHSSLLNQALKTQITTEEKEMLAAHRPQNE
jgi:uncharacterized protein